MIEKKDPDQKIVEDDFSDDDPIIELTDEVIIEPGEDRKIPSPKTADFIPPKVNKDPSFGDDEDIIIFEENAIPALQNDPFTEADGQSADDDNRIGLIDKFKAESPGDDDVFIMVNGQDEVEGDSTAIISDDAIEMTGDETRNNFDDDIELEYESDGEEINFSSGVDERAEDIIEITEFDQHFTDDDEVLDQAGQLNPSGLEDEDFLEIFDIEDENPMEDEEMRKLSESKEKAVEAELNRFFDDALEDEPAIEKNTPPPVEKFSELDTDLDGAMSAAALSAGAEKIDRPDTPFPQNPTNEKDLTSLPKDPSEKDDHLQKDSPASHAGDSAVVSPEQINQAIERIINEKLDGRIEHIIYEIIEKTVKREIDRLKAALLEDSTPEDNL